MMILKVVFFGDNVPKDRADKAIAAAKDCDAFLALGSSLMTMSAYRLVRYTLLLLGNQKHVLLYRNLWCVKEKLNFWIECRTDWGWIKHPVQTTPSSLLYFVLFAQVNRLDIISSLNVRSFWNMVDQCEA